MNEIFKPYISEPQYSDYISVKKYNGCISKEQANDDLTILRYLMKNRYCGWEYYNNSGIVWESCFKSIESYILSQNNVYISDFCKKIHEAFDVGIVDNHLAFCSPLTGRLSYSKQFIAYFADFKVEQRGEQFYVVESNCSDIVDGDIIDAGKNLFPTLSQTRYNRYLVGIRSFVPVTEIELIVNGKLTFIPLHRCRAIQNEERHDICMHHVVRNEIDILRSNCCDYVGDLSEKTDFVELGKQFKEKDVLILNYLSNEGGYNRITREFILGLNSYSHCQEHSIKLVSPVTEEKSCNREWVSLSESEPYDYSKATFNGTLILLVNADTASAGESAVLYARSCKNLVVVGENTMGCNTFGNVASYMLPHSNIVCRIPNVINLCHTPDECIEGYGFTPDYWVDSDDIEGEVIKWLKNHKKSL